jgi:glycosyltransferase involved in cell wall biosynthesis
VRLLEVIAEMGHGGAERIAVQLAADSVRHGAEVVVASGGGSWVEQIRAAGARHELVPLGQRSPSATLGSSARLAGLVRRFRPEIVHAHNVRATVAVAPGLVGLRPRPRLLTTLHGVAPGDYPATARLLRLAGGRVVACAPSVGRSLVAAGFPARRVEVITNCAALVPASEAELAALRARLGAGDRPLVAGIGRLVPQKAWHLLIEAARRFDDADVVVAGEGPLRAELETMAAAGGGRVRFVGVIEQPASLLGLAACVVSTSAWEGLPLSLLEALGLGVPTVASAVDGVDDVVPNHAALLVPPGDPAAVAAGVNRVLRDRAFAERLARQARLAAAAWAPETMLVQYRARYAALLSSPS